MARALATLVAFYSDQETAPQAMRELRRGGFRRVATIRHAEPGRLMVTDNDVSPGVGALIGALLALGVLVTSFSRFFPSYAPPPTVPWLAVAGAVVLIGAGVGWLCARWLDFGVDEATLTRFRRWVLPGETLLILQAPPSRGPEVLAQLRQVQGATPTTFVLRPSHELGWSGGMSGERPPLERFTTERLKSHAAALAAAHEIEPRRRRWGRGRPLWGRLRGSERTIESVVVGLTEAVHLEQSISLAAEWLLDNGYIMRRHIGDVRRNLSRSLYDVLPLLRGQVLSGPGGLLGSMGAAGAAGPSRPHDQPRVYALALEFVSHTDGEVHVADVVEFLRAYQETAPLTSGELWAMPLMLRLALIENLGRLAVAIDRRQYEHERADLWANRLLSAARRDPDQLLFILAELAREHPQPPPYFALRLVSQLQGEATALDPIRGWLERKLSTPLPDVIQHEQLRQAADQVTVANAIGSLRRLSSVDWRDVFEEISLVHQVLCEDPAGVYARMDFGTRDHYRHAVEEIAEPARLSEVEVARLAVEVSNESGIPRPESRVDRSPGTRDAGLATHVGYHLVDDGRLAFERRAGSRPRPGRRFRRWVLAHPALIYLGGIALLTAALLAETLVVAHRLDVAGPLLVAMGLVALLPVSELAVQLVNNLSTELLKPRVLPKLNFEDGIPEEWRTLVVVPVLFQSVEEVREDLERLELRALANPDPNLHFALLMDFPDAPQLVMPEDASLLATAVSGIEQLNARYGSRRFSLFHRPRQWSVTEQVWMGWERKRGKLEELNRLLVSRLPGNGNRDVRGTRPTTMEHVGHPEALDGIRSVITLDSDTQLPFGAARRLIEAMAHPLNRPRLAPDGQMVVGGYTVIQPRVSTSLPSATATRFSRFFTDPVGTDPYTQAVADVYQDLTGEASYFGKGIYDVATFHRVLDGRFPDGLLLSHDLVEGAHVRVGLASDIELYDQFPSSYLAYSRRSHRWIRGDWQIADWCTPRVPAGAALRGSRRRRVPNPLSTLNRLKIFDNLRRSLVPPATVALLLTGWLAAPRAAALWSVLAALVFLLPPLLRLIAWITLEPRAALDFRRGGHGWHEQANAWVRGALTAVFLPHQAWVNLDAIVRVFYRRWISHRRLLQWQTSRMALPSGGQSKRQLIGHLLPTTILALLTASALSARAPEAIPAALPFLLAWILAPAAAVWLDSGRRRPASAALSPGERTLLRRVARQTWRYFDDLVGPQTNWLPPDNYQTALRVEVARRTSPTNIGLWFLSTLAARDFGYVTLDQVVERLLATMDTLHKVERFEGHLLNWYHTQTLAPLPPRYVSMVDSGNLLACLWALRHGAEDMVSEPVLGPAVLQGLRDTLALIQEWPATELPVGAATGKIRHLIATLGVLFDNPPEQLPEIVRRLRAAAGPAHELAELLGQSSSETEASLPHLAAAEAEPGSGTEAAYWARQVERQVDAALDVVKRYLSWVEPLVDQPEDRLQPLGEAARAWRRQALTRAPSLRALASGEFGPLTALLALRAVADELSPALRTWLHEVTEEASRARWLAGEMLGRVQQLMNQAEDLSSEMNMRFLYDPERRLFSIGYNVSEMRIDPSLYDLLPSEARLGSFVAIARGEIPVEHWWALGRSFGLAAGRRVLLSWSGTMFEYLMPLLLTRSYEHSLLDEACRAAVAAQIAYARQRSVPWGISEAAFAGVDASQIYQYQAFGVPGLGLKRGLEDDLVVAPYATALALLVAPHEAARNLRRLARQGMRGPYGYYESIDFTPQRQPAGQSGVIVYTYMAHHQGMTLVAIDNALHDGVMPRRFHADPRVRTAEPLLFERIPAAPQISERITRAEAPVRGAPPAGTGTGAGAASRFTSPNTPTPRTQLLSNGSYAVMITNAGGGYSRWRDFDLVRWRADTTLDAWGAFCYVKDVEQGTVWSTTYQPVRRPTARYEVWFSNARVEFERRDAGIGTHTELAVSSEDDAEVRRLTLVNYSSRPRRLSVTSYLELALATHNADAAHPAFSKMFVQTEATPEGDVLLARRKPRAPHDPPVWAFHLVALPPGAAGTEVQYETDRARFIGRGRTLENPIALEGQLSNTTGSVLDPIFSLRVGLTLAPGERVQLAFITGAAESRERALELVEKYRDLRAGERAFELAWSRAQLEPRHLRVTVEDLQRYQQLASYMIYPNARLRASEPQLRQNQLGQSHLWAYGISGDLPLILVTVGAERDLDQVREVLMAHTYWRLRGFKADLLILNEEAAGYEQPLREQLRKLIQVHAQYTGIDQPGGIFARAAGAIPAEDLALLNAVARVVLVASRGPLVQQLSQPAPTEGARLPAPLVIGRRYEEEPSPPLPFMELPYFNGLGGFTADGREYAIYLAPQTTTPAPWVNVMANPSFGALVSESGQGFCWSQNSQSNRLLPWSNDPVIDPCGDAIYLRDEHSGVFWTPTAQPIRELDAYRARHGQGYTIFEHNSHAIEQELTTFVPLDTAGGAPVRLQRLRLRNRSSRRRRLSATLYGEWVLGGTREETQMHVVSSWDAESQALLARNVYHPDFGRRVAFASASLSPVSYTADRTEFLGRNGSPGRPAAMTRQSLGGRTGAGLDPCVALQVVVEIDPGQEAEVSFAVGQAADVAEARRLVRRFRDPLQVEGALQATRSWWDDLLGTIQVQTPDLAINFLLNRWLMYQTLSCRIWGRSAFYQSGGAFGFRDQLQDAMATVYAAPHLTRAQILNAAAHQFKEGDVQHWWHPQSAAGVRTRITDDLLWLPYVTAHYVRITGDRQILDEVVPFLDGRLLEEHEHEAYFLPGVAPEGGTLLEHCRRAIARGLTAGPHGLPLIGTGDWNDGLNLVGAEGKGESVWLAWFLVDVLQAFADLLDSPGSRVPSPESEDLPRNPEPGTRNPEPGTRNPDRREAEWYRQQARRLARAVEEHAWDGAWYRRAYFDDGTPLGSRTNEEAKIDSIPQSWAVISGAADPQRAAQSLRSADEYLVREAEQLILLFTPPFEHAPQNPGYIKGYPPGVRENGGQYTHAALWLAMAHARRGDGDRAVQLLRLINPVEHARTPEDAGVYKVEPYVVAADVYALQGHVGRGGWTWYTGSSGWMYRVWLEEIFGFKRRGDRLHFDPRIPQEWDGIRLRYRHGRTWYDVTYHNPDRVGQGVLWIELDGQRYDAGEVPLSDDGASHTVTVRLGRAQPPTTPPTPPGQPGQAATPAPYPAPAAMSDGPPPGAVDGTTRAGTDGSAVRPPPAIIPLPGAPPAASDDSWPG